MIEFNRRGFNTFLEVYESYYMAQRAIERMENMENYKSYDFLEQNGIIYEINYNYMIKKTRVGEQEVYEILRYRTIDVAAN